VTVRDWISHRSATAPPKLTEQVLYALGRDADDDVARTGDRCLTAAARSLETILADRRFGRDSAIDLLTVDALMTFAYEFASSTAPSAESLDELASKGATRIGRLASIDG
jgi:hypothetical protein